MTETCMTIREMCDAYDVTPRTLRFYEAKELLSPIRVGTRRLFTDRDRARLTLILRGKRFGLSLEEIRQLLNIYDSEGGVIAQIRAFQPIALQRLDALQAERATLDAAISELQHDLTLVENMLEMEDRPAAA